ncbi:alpha/beta hydrolase [Pendulispora brunnea]|uniref:Alpha/beta hydrolase n=1 Tax=Pendulispora brunnea TaxID=2905690 RepID=A0ABZ2K9Z1_9BACT
MREISLSDANGSFAVTVHQGSSPSRVVLFAVGGGGDPQRHLPLLSALVECGCSVVAPHFARLGAPAPTDDELLLRAQRLRLALDVVARPGAVAVGVGHSIGAAMLLALAGGEVWMRPGHKLPIAGDARLARLALLAPATGFFGAPGALDNVRAPIAAWAGTNDAVTPPEQAQLLARALGTRVPVDVRVVEGAGHFSFMNTPPTHTTEPLPDRDAFLAQLTREVCAFAMS